MGIVTMSSRQFNQDIGRAKKAALNGPVIITDRSKPSFVLLSIDEYQKITAREESVVDRLTMPGVADIEFEPEKLNTNFIKPEDL